MDRKLSFTEVRQLFDYAKTREDEGWYYGNKTQFDNRHMNIMLWLQQELTKFQEKTSGS